MEIRQKNLGSYSKSGKCFINIDRKNSILDSISKYEYNVFQYNLFKTQSKLGNNFNISFDKTFKEKDIITFENAKNTNQAHSPSLKIYDYFKTNYVSFGSYRTLATPSTFPNITYTKNQNININELEKYPKFLETKQDKKKENEDLKRYLFDDTNNENLYKKENIFSSQSKLASPSLNPFFYQKYLEIENKNLERQQSLIEGKNEYSFLGINQKKEKMIEIELNPILKKDLNLQFLNPFMKEGLEDNDPNSPEYIEYSASTSSELSSIRAGANHAERKFYKFNLPFAIYNFSERLWEYRGLIYPLYHMAQWYINTRLDNTHPSIDQGLSNDKHVAKIVNIEWDSNKILDENNGFLDYFKKYFGYYCPLTNTPSVITKKIVQNNLKPFYTSPLLSVPTEQFGFPNHFKFHAFNENLLNMSNFIEKPFVLSRTSFSTNVELICEIDDKDGFYQEPVNACLNYFIIKQTEMIENENINTDWSPVSLNKEANSSFIKDSSELFKNDLKVEKDTNVISDKQNIPRVLNNDNLIHLYKDSAYDKGSLYGYDFYNNPPGSNLLTTSNKKFVREIVNFGNALFVSPSEDLVLNDLTDENIIPLYNNIVKNNELLSYLEQNNFDLIKVIEYQNHSNLLTSLDKTAILDFSGEISINSPSRVSTLIKSPVNSHLINFDFELSAGNNFEKFNLQRSLNDINSGRHIGQKQNFENINLNAYDYGSLNIPEEYNDKRRDANKNDYYFQEIKDLNSKSLSPYILYPHDKIALCVSISPIIHPKSIKQIIAIKDGKCKFSLFGHFLQDEKKITDENDVLKNYHTNNLPNVVVGDILNTNEYSNFTNLNYLSYLDKYFTKDLDFKISNRGLDDFPSKILSGKTFIPYNRIGNDYNLNANEKFIYDDAFLQYSQETEEQNNKTYYSNNIFENLLFFKDYNYKLKNENYNEKEINLNLKTFNCYFSKNRYGHLRDMFEQRSYTTLYNVTNNIKENIIEKQFINSVNGQIITDLTNMPNINKSLTYELVNSGLNPVNINDFSSELAENVTYPFYDNTMRWNKWTWTRNEISKLKHVAFRENVNSVD